MSSAFSGRFFEPRGFSNPAGFDYAAYLQAKGIRRTVSLKQESEIELLQRGTGLFRQIQDWRERIRLAFIASTTGPGSAILQAMTLGEEGGLTDDMRDQLHGRRRHPHHFHLRVPPRHGRHPLLRTDQDHAAASAGAALSPPDPGSRPEKDRRLAHPSVPDLLYAPCRGTGRHGPFAHHAHCRAGGHPAGPRERAHPFPCPRSPVHSRRKSPGCLRHIVPVVVPLGPGHRFRGDALERTSGARQEPPRPVPEQRTPARPRLPEHHPRDGPPGCALLQSGIARRRGLEHGRRSLCGLHRRAARPVLRDPVAPDRHAAAAGAEPARCRPVLRHGHVLLAPAPGAVPSPRAGPVEPPGLCPVPWFRICDRQVASALSVSAPCKLFPRAAKPRGHCSGLGTAAYPFNSPLSYASPDRNNTVSRCRAG